MRFLPPLGLLLAGAWFALGIDWGLPSRRTDAYLFGSTVEPWSGKRILELAGGWEEAPDRGADVDLNPVTGRQRPVVLNATDEQRAEIVRRYRLFSHQPDEMITFRSLSQMRPGEGKLDPRLYQYGGLWIYPVGALLKAASVLKLVELRSDLAYYLDNPHAFGRFYVVARLYSAAWGVVGAWAVYRLVKKLTAGTDMHALAPYAAAACFAAMPVVVNMAHEAKPHLAGAVLMLLAVLAGANYVETGRRRSWVVAGALCGAAFGMVLSALPVFVVLPLMALLRREATWRQRAVVTVASAVIGVDVYFLTNPYVLLHLVGPGDALKSNLGNSAAMYSAGGSAGALLNSAKLLAEGAGFWLAVVGAVGAVVLGRRAVRVRKDVSPVEVSRRAAGLLLAAPALLALAQFVALAADKPGEYGRFALLPALFFMIEAVVLVATVDDGFHLSSHNRFKPGPVAYAMLIFVTAMEGGAYLARFIEDASGPTTRFLAAQTLSTVPGGTAIAVDAEPAPYSLPPVNLFDRRIILLPRVSRPGPSSAPGPTTQATTHETAAETPAVLVMPVDEPDGVVLPPADRWRRKLPARISWAGKHFRATPGSVDGVGD